MKKIFLIAICVCLVAFVASCGKEEATSEKSNVEESQLSSEIVYNGWETSLLSTAGIQYVEAPEGDITFTGHGNGNFEFTVKPAEASMVSGLGASIFSQVSNLTDDISPMSVTNAIDSENRFKIAYTYNGKKISIEVAMNGDVLEGSVTFE